jgi:hexosaminidase
MANRIVSGQASSEDWQQARQLLLLWRGNDAKLQPLVTRSFLTQDLAPVSRNLSQVAEIGVQVLDDLQDHRLVNAGVRQRNIDFLKAAAKPQAVLVLMIAPSVELLVEATQIR